MTASAFRRNPAVEEAPLQGELMLFDPATSKFFVLNRTMAYLWRGCDGQRTFGELVSGAEQQFASVDESRVKVDFSKALEDLKSMGLLLEAGQEV